jgi:hypothetical protein
MTVTVDKTMNDKSPPDKLVVSVQVPKMIWAGNLVDFAADG